MLPAAYAALFHSADSLKNRGAAEIASAFFPFPGHLLPQAPGIGDGGGVRDRKFLVQLGHLSSDGQVHIRAVVLLRDHIKLLCFRIPPLFDQGLHDQPFPVKEGLYAGSMLSKLFKLRIVPILPQAPGGALGTLDKELLVASGLPRGPAVIRPNAEEVAAVNLARMQTETKLLLSGSRFSNIVTELLKFFRIFPNGNFRRPEVGVIFPSKIIRIRKTGLTKHSSQVMQLNMQGMGGVLNVSVLKQIVDQL